MRNRLAPFWLVALAVFAGSRRATSQEAAAKPPQPPKTVRLYVFDCGVINVNRAGTERYKVTPGRGWRDAFLRPVFSSPIRKEP